MRRPFQILLSAIALMTPGMAATKSAGPCPGSWSEALAGTKQMKALSSYDDGQAQRQDEFSAAGIDLLGRTPAHIFLTNDIGGGSISYVFDGTQDEIRGSVFEAYKGAASCTGRSCAFTPSRSGDLEEAIVTRSFTALQETGTRKIEKPALICGFRP